jgi:hypothetical protein
MFEEKSVAGRFPWVRFVAIGVLLHRDRGDVYPSYRDAATGLFDLGRWNDEYWRKFDYFLRATHDRRILVQIEIWATYDFYTRPGHVYDGLTAWDRNPFNPANNSNYTEGESGLFATFRSLGHQLINPCFNTVLPLPQPVDFGIRSTWQQPQTVDVAGILEMKTPAKGHWAVLVLAR